MTQEIVALCDAPYDIVKQTASIFLTAWPDHYMEEYGITTIDEMLADLLSNYCESPGNIDCTYAMVESGSVIGTVALLREDLKSHSYLQPWITCLWVSPEKRNMGLSKTLWRRAFADAGCDRAYLWTDDAAKAESYARQGATIFDRIGEVFVMKIERPRSRL